MRALRWRPNMAAAARLLIPVLLGALLSTADACLSNSDCSENTFCSVNSEGCEKCFWDWSFGAKCGAHDYCTIRGVQCPPLALTVTVTLTVTLTLTLALALALPPTPTLTLTLTP